MSQALVSSVGGLAVTTGGLITSYGMWVTSWVVFIQRYTMDTIVYLWMNTTRGVTWKSTVVCMLLLSLGRGVGSRLGLSVGVVSI